MVARPTINETHVHALLELGPSTIADLTRAFTRAGTPISSSYVRRLCGVLVASGRARELSIKTVRVRRGVALYALAGETNERIDAAVSVLRAATSGFVSFGRPRP